MDSKDTVTNLDIFREFTRRIREDGASDEELMQEYGGMPIYVPSWKLNGRNDEIIKDYLENKLNAKQLAMKYSLSGSQIYEIINKVRTPQLFS
jgi:Mor family transcriptional regulator